MSVYPFFSQDIQRVMQVCCSTVDTIRYGIFRYCFVFKKMNIEEFRAYCLSLPEVSEATPFEKFTKGRLTVLVFYIQGHMFCYFNVDDFSEITIKSTPEEMSALKERYKAVGEPFNGDKRHWIGVKIGSDMTDAEIKTLVLKSYELVRNKHKKANKNILKQ